MKKVFVCLVIALTLCSCSPKTEYNNNSAIEGSGVWLSFYELERMLKSKEGFKYEFDKVTDNCISLRIENLYVHTRAFGETIYNSDYFPILESVKKYNYDIFDYIIEQCKAKGIKVYAWINPYRMSASADKDKLALDSACYKWLTDTNKENDKNIGFSNGIYLNPASTEARGLVLDGIRELMTRYDIEGIHFDDYFYPTQEESFDKVSYSEYLKSTENILSLSDWRRENVNMLISSCYSAIKYADNNIIFSISPTASLENNYQNLYADVEAWIKNGWADEIIPQLYFGFEYPDEDFRFERLLAEWKYTASQNNNVNLKIGLACYKAKPDLEPDKAEWQSRSDIIARQTKILRNDTDISGYVYFSYSSLFGEEKEYKAQADNLKKYLKNEIKIKD